MQKRVAVCIDLLHLGSSTSGHLKFDTPSCTLGFHGHPKLNPKSPRTQPIGFWGPNTIYRVDLGPKTLLFWFLDP